MKILIVVLTSLAFVLQPAAAPDDLAVANTQAPGICDLWPWFPLC